jgi:hypothetical protein
VDVTRVRPFVLRLAVGVTFALVVGWLDARVGGDGYSLVGMAAIVLVALLVPARGRWSPWFTYARRPQR